MIRLFGLFIMIFLGFGITASNINLKCAQILSVADGLSHNGVTSILQDSKGFFWIGTYDGLNRYDGYNFKVFKNEVGNYILPSNRIRSLEEDSRGNLWVGTEDGLVVFDYQKETFTTIFSNSQVNRKGHGPVFIKIFFNEKRRMLFTVTESEGVLIFNEKGELQSRFKFTEMFPDIKSISNCSAFNDDLYLLSTSNGLIIFDWTKEKYERIIPDLVANISYASKVDDDYLMVAPSRGLSIYRIQENENGYSFKQINQILPQVSVKYFALDELDNIWLALAAEGVGHINNVKSVIADKPFEYNLFDAEMPFVRSSTAIITRNHGCWVGTFNKGIFRFDIGTNPFKTISVGKINNNQYQFNQTTILTSIDKDWVLMNANDGQFIVFNTNTSEIKLPVFDISVFGNSRLNNVFIDNSGNYWLNVMYEGLHVLKKDNSKLYKVDMRNIRYFNQAQIRSACEDSNGNVWFGGVDGVIKVNVDGENGLGKVELLNDHSFFQFQKLSVVWAVYVDPLFNFVWLGTATDGLFRIKVEPDKPISEAEVSQFKVNLENQWSISSNFVTSMQRLPDSSFWVGTEGGGFCEVLNSDEDPQFIPYTEKNGLSNNVVKKIIYDGNGNLWASTNNGLNKFDIANKRIRVFNVKDGLPFDSFWFTGELLDNGKLIWSGLDGFCYFDPKDISNDDNLPKLEFESIKILNKTLAPGDSLNGRVLYEKRFSDIDKIELKHDENVFSIEVNALHYSNPANHYLRYRLLPANEEWIEVTSDQKLVSFNSLPPDTYYFEAMASNSLGDWTNVKRIEIEIKPPFWRTIYAYIIYLALGISILTLILIFIVRMKLLSYNLRFEKMEKDREKELNAAKLRYFSNISHEIKTPLTLIGGPINLLMERYGTRNDIKKQLNIVQRQSSKITHLIDQVHDFQKSEANKLRLEKSVFCLDTFIAAIIEDFRYLADIEHKIITLEKAEEMIYVNADKDKLEKILNNLLNNAFKYTGENDEIRLKYFIENNHVKINVADSGIGISEEDLPHIFERFYQSRNKLKNDKGGSGIGLAFTQRLVEMHYGTIYAKSNLGEGTTMLLSMPIVEKKPDDEEIKRIESILEAENHWIEKDLVKEVNKAVTVNRDFEKSSIFILEDNPDMRNFITDFLSSYFKVKAFADGLQCLEHMELEWPDIILSDVLMPNMNGLELCKIIKTDVKTSHIPIILLTACTSIDDQIEGISKGADAYIKKPFDLQYLVTTIESLLIGRKKLHERFNIGLPLSLDNKDVEKQDNIFLEKLYMLFEEHLDDQDLDINFFAKKLYLSRSNFYHKVKAVAGKTPYEMLKLYRLKKAADLLSSEKYSVNDVFMMTGFKSRAHFNKLFKEAYDATPGQYANKIKQKYN